MFAAQSMEGARDGDWVRDGLNGDESGGSDGAEECGLEDDCDEGEGHEGDFFCDNQEEEEDGEGDDGSDNNEENEEDYGSASDGREESGSSGQSDLDVWYAQVMFCILNSIIFLLVWPQALRHSAAQDGVDFTRLPHLKQHAAMDDNVERANDAARVADTGAAAADADAQQEAYNKEFERAALLDVLMRETPRPDDDATGIFKCGSAAGRACGDSRLLTR
jgi:hypothetical protein